MDETNYLEERVRDLERKVDGFMALVLPVAIGKRVKTGRVKRHGGFTNWDYGFGEPWSGLVTRADTESVWFESDGTEYQTTWEFVRFEGGK